MVTFSVGPDKKKFAVHKDALFTMTNDFFCAQSNPGNPETESVDHADFPEEKAETIKAFMKWLYAGYLGLTLHSLPCSMICVFELYGFAYRHLITRLKDIIVYSVYEKFNDDNSNLWFSLGSDKLALETFLRVIPSDTHLYRLVIRSLAYSVRLRSEYQGLEPDRTFRRSSTPVTDSQVKEVIESVPNELWGPISKEILLVKMLGPWSQGFASTVGCGLDFRERSEDLDGIGISERR